LYRAATDDELQTFQQVRSHEGLDELVWALIYRQGPSTTDKLAAITHLEDAELESILTRLVDSGRAERVSEGKTPSYKAGSLFVPVGATAGWEAAIFDHFQAMVKTICCRLRQDRATSSAGDEVGGSTFTIDVWPGHPQEEQVRSTLARLRSMLIELRHSTDEYNAAHGIPERHEQVVLYVGQCLVPQGDDDND
jgi:hypothetical protein